MVDDMISAEPISSESPPKEVHKTSIDCLEVFQNSTREGAQGVWPHGTINSLDPVRDTTLL